MSACRRRTAGIAGCAVGHEVALLHGLRGRLAAKRPSDNLRQVAGKTALDGVAIEFAEDAAPEPVADARPHRRVVPAGAEADGQRHQLRAVRQVVAAEHLLPPEKLPGGLEAFLGAVGMIPVARERQVKD